MGVNKELIFYYRLLLNDISTIHIQSSIKNMLGDMGYTGSLNTRLVQAADAATITYLQLSDGSYVQLSDGSFAYI